MSRQLFYFSVLGLALSACSSHDNKRAQGNFDYAQKQEAKAFVATLASEGKQILFVAGKNEARNIIKNSALSGYSLFKVSIPTGSAYIK